MKHIFKGGEVLMIRSMGKSFRVLAIFDSDDEANAYMAKHDNASCIAAFGQRGAEDVVVFIADKYDNGVDR